MNVSLLALARRAPLCNLALMASLLLLAGCGTTTQKLATEQLLMSDAVDTAIARIDFRHLEGKSVYLDTSFIKPVKAVGFVNADYIVSSLRQQLTAANCMIQDKRDTADIIIEPRVGALGTDGHEITYGVPQTSAITSAAALFTNSPIAPTVPEISLGRNVAQSGIAKIIVFAYERESKAPVWQSGVAKAESTSSSTWLLGAGPFQKGTIYDGFRFAGKRFPGQDERVGMASQLPDKVGYNAEYVFTNPDNNDEKETEAAKTEAVADSSDASSKQGVQQASHTEEAKDDK